MYMYMYFGRTTVENSSTEEPPIVDPPNKGHNNIIQITDLSIKDTFLRPQMFAFL